MSVCVYVDIYTTLFKNLSKVASSKSEIISFDFQGYIGCTVQYNGIFSVNADDEVLDVTEPSREVMLISPATLTVFSYEKIVLKCLDTTYQSLDFKWYKEGAEIKPGGKFS